MTTKMILRYLLCALLLASGLTAGIARAQQRLEIIPLQHRLPEQVLPALLPLVEQGGMLTTANNKLLLRASPANIEEIRRALAAIDTPLRRLLVSVRQDDASDAVRTGGGVESGRVIIDRSGRMSVEGRIDVGRSTQQRATNAQQQVQTVEGGDAAIFLGRSLPLPMRAWAMTPAGATVTNSVQYVDIGSGFIAHPELSGDRVFITITPQMQRVGRDGIDSARLSTQISGRLGEWIALGGGSVDGDSARRTSLDGGDVTTRRSANVWLKVEALD